MSSNQQTEKDLIVKRLDRIDELKSRNEKIERDITKSLKDREEATKRLLILSQQEFRLQVQLSKIHEREDKLIDSISNKLEHQIKTLELKNKKTNIEIGLLNESKKLQDKINQSIQAGTINVSEINKEYKTLSSLIQDASKEHARINYESDLLLNNINNIIKRIPILGNSFSAVFSKLLKSKFGPTLEKGIFKILNGSFLKKVIPGIGLAVGGGEMFKEGIELKAKLEQQLKDQQRSIGLTNEQSTRLDQVQYDLLKSSKSIITSLDEARQASSLLVDDFGTIGAFSSKLIDNQVRLTKIYGMTGDQALSFQKASMVIGQNVDQTKQDVLSTVAGFNKLYGSSISLTKTLQRVASTSEYIKIQFQGNLKELTAATIQAQLLGTSLEDLNNIADSLLNIESSIESQITAQLVTGKNINLDLARRYALENNNLGLMTELQKQNVDYNSFSKMNRIEQQSISAALGMSVDQMSKFVTQQELATRLGINLSNNVEADLVNNKQRVEMLAQAGDELAKQYIAQNEMLTVQEKMTAAIERLNRMLQMSGSIIAGIGAGLAAAALYITIMTGGANLLAAAALTGIAGGFGGYLTEKFGPSLSSTLPGMATGGTVLSSGQVMVGEQGPEIVHLPKNAQVTPNRDLSKISTNDMTETNNLLRTLISKIDQPSVIKLGETTINEIGSKIAMKRDYRIGIGNTYNRT